MLKFKTKFGKRVSRLLQREKGCSLLGIIGGILSYSILKTRIKFFNSSTALCEKLRRGGALIGKGCIFRDPHSTRIDMTRPWLISIGDNVDMNVNFQIWTHDWASRVFINKYGSMLNSSGRVSLGNNIYIGANVTVLKGVSIGDNCVIGAGSVVSKSIPSNSVAVGNPCKVVSSIDEYYEKRKGLSFNEAIDCVNAYVNRYGDIPQEKDFIEECIYFKGTNEVSVKFKDYSDFIDYCRNYANK